ncbi:MAG: ATP-binding cassette domain-containing protein, partial [Armatimonadetes bacterium]|nr:ATP-binding cassette domain-containing protein [Armatimonadota bacterium]
RPANAIPPVLSLLFGPAAAWGCAIGNLIGDFFGSIGPGSAFGFVGNFLLGYLPYRLWKAWAPRWRATGSLAQLPLLWLVTIISSAACSLVISGGVDWLGQVPFPILFPLITLNNAVMGVVIGPILLALMYPRAARWGLLADEVHEAEDLRNGLLAPVAGLIVLAACVGGWVLLKHPTLLSAWAPGVPVAEGKMPPPFALTPLRAGAGLFTIGMLVATAFLARMPRRGIRGHDPNSMRPNWVMSPNSAPMPALALERVSFRYKTGREAALRDLSLSIEPGHFVALMGRTGAGKSTLCRCANGLVPQFFAGEFAGHVSAFGAPVSETPVRGNAGLVGSVFQDFDAQLISSDVSLEVAFAMENLGVPREEMQTRVAEALARVGLTGFERRDPETLSGGEKQRLAIASVLAARPKLVVLDEPTTDLDPQGKEEVFAAARDLVREGLTVLMAEHEPDHALAADRVIALAEGRVAYDGPSRKLLTDPERCRDLGIRLPDLPACFAAVGASERPATLEEAEEHGRKRGLRIDPEALAELKRTEAERAAEYGDATIEVRDLVHEYTPGVEAVSGVSLTIRQGEFVALLGQNGSGKTTLAKHLNGLLKATRGTVSFLPPRPPFLQKGGETADGGFTLQKGGEEADGGFTLQKRGGEADGGFTLQKGGEEADGGFTRGPRVPLGVGYVFQDPDHQIFCATVREEVEFGPRTLGLDMGRVEEALEATGLSDLADADPFTLTKGERQAVAVASALACDPQVLVLDEPTTGLDGPQQERMMDLLRDLNARGRTVVIITHSMWAAASYAHRVVVMAHGKVIADGPTREVFANADALAEAHLRPTATAELSQALFGVTLLSPEEFGRVVKASE